MEDFNKRAFLYLLCSGIFFSIIGVLGVFSPVFFSIYLVYILGAFFLVSGIQNFTRGFQFRKVKDFHWGMLIFIGFLEIILSLSLFTTPVEDAFFIIVYIGLFMAFKGIFIIVNLIFNKKVFPELMNTSFGSGVIDLLFGILLVVVPLRYPELSLQFVFLCIAWYILFSGASLILGAFTFKRATRK